MSQEGLTEGGDEFGFEPPVVKEVDVKLETRGEIVSSVYESSVTQDLSEKKAIETIQYGDLMPEQRGSRRFEEILWTTQKRALDRCVIFPPHFKMPKEPPKEAAKKVSKKGKKKVSSPPQAGGKTKPTPSLPPPPGGEAQSQIICGTNGTFCFSLECKDSIAQGYLTALQTLEVHSLDQELGHRFVHMKTQGDAKEFMALLNVLLKREPVHEKLLRSFLEKVEKKILSKTLPEGKETYGKEVHATERVFPVVTTIEHKLLDYNKERLADQPYDEFTLYYCNTSKLDKSPGWLKAKMAPFRTTLDTVPCLAFNETHLAVLSQPYDEPDASVVTIYLYRLNEHPTQNPCDLFHFQFPKEHFTEQGLLNMTMNTEGIITVAFANGVVAIDTKRELAPRIFLAGTHVVISSTAHKRETIFLGTQSGESLGVDWATGDVVSTEVSPVIEPIYSIHHSNKRTFMHTACAVSGRMNPYQTDGLTHLPTARVTGIDVCGTLIFAVEKYGVVQVMSSNVRGMVFPFKAPKELFKHKQKDPNSCLPLEKQEYETVLCPPYYPSIKVTPDRMVVIYQNGLIVIYYISKEGHRWIEKQLKPQSNPPPSGVGSTTPKKDSPPKGGAAPSKKNGKK